MNDNSSRPPLGGTIKKPKSVINTEVEVVDVGPLSEKAAKERQLKQSLRDKTSDADKLDLAQIRKTIFNEQCFLLGMARHLFTYARSNDERSAKKLATAKRGKLTDAAIEVHKMKAGKSRQNTTQVHRSPHYAILEGDPSELINMISVNPDIYALFQANSFQLSQLVPHIEIFKVLKGGDDFSFPFKNYSDLESIEKVTGGIAGFKGAYRGDGAGIKSVEFTLEGRNPATSNFVDVKIKLYFQDVKMLFLDLSKGMSFADLIRFSPSHQTKRSFRIRMKLGWSQPDSKITTTKAFNKAIKMANTNLILDLIEHALDFREDGSVELSVHYKGAIEDSLNTAPWADILMLNQEQLKKRDEGLERVEKPEDLKERVNKLAKSRAKRFREKINIAKTKVKAAQAVATSRKAVKWFSEARVAVAKEEVKQIQKSAAALDKRAAAFIKHEKEKHEQERRSEHAGQIAGVLHELFTSNKFLSRTFFVELTKDELGKLDTFFTGGYGEQFGAEGWASGAKKEEIKKNIFKAKAGPGGIKKFKDYQRDLVDETKYSQAQHKMSARAALRGQLAGQGKKGAVSGMLGTFDSGWRSAKKAGARRIAFVFLGDIIDVILEKIGPSIAEQKKLTNFKVLLGPIIYTDPVSKQPVTNLSIADIPVSTDILNKFFIDKIVGEGRRTYVFQEFIEDLVDLVTTQTLRSCLESSAALAGTKIEFSPLIGSAETTKSLVGRAGIKGLEFTQAPQNRTGDMHNYMLVFSQSSGMFLKKLNGGYEENLKRRIYHFFVGGPDSGILKSVKYKEDKNAKLAVALFAKNQSSRLVDDPGIIEQRKLSVELTLIGNPLFTIGQTIFVDASLVDGGYFVKEGLRYTGYYTITKVSSVLDETTYETKINAIMMFSVIDSEGMKGLKDTYRILTSIHKLAGSPGGKLVLTPFGAAMKTPLKEKSKKSKDKPKKTTSKAKKRRRRRRRKRKKSKKSKKSKKK